MNVNPPDVPTPGMAGGEKPKATASGSLLSSRLRWALMAWNCSARVFRSPQSFMLTNAKRCSWLRTKLSRLKPDECR